MFVEGSAWLDFCWSGRGSCTRKRQIPCDAIRPGYCGSVGGFAAPGGSDAGQNAGNRAAHRTPCNKKRFIIKSHQINKLFKQPDFFYKSKIWKSFAVVFKFAKFEIKLNQFFFNSVTKIFLAHGSGSRFKYVQKRCRSGWTYFECGSETMQQSVQFLAQKIFSSSDFGDGAGGGDREN